MSSIHYRIPEYPYVNNLSYSGIEPQGKWRLLVQLIIHVHIKDYVQSYCESYKKLFCLCY